MLFRKEKRAYQYQMISFFYCVRCPGKLGADERKNGLFAVAHTGFSYGVGTVSSPGPYPEKAPPLFLFSSNLRYIIFQNDILITFCIPRRYLSKGGGAGPERALYGPLAKNERHDMCDLLVSFQV